MSSLFESLICCPYCNQSFTVFIDVSQGNYRSIEDSYVCCRPIEFLVESDGNQLIRLDTFTDTASVF